LFRARVGITKTKTLETFKIVAHIEQKKQNNNAFSSKTETIRAYEKKFDSEIVAPFCWDTKLNRAAWFGWADAIKTQRSSAWLPGNRRCSQ